MTIGLRISEADEDEGMDASIHGEGTSSRKTNLLAISLTNLLSY